MQRKENQLQRDLYDVDAADASNRKILPAMLQNSFTSERKKMKTDKRQFDAVLSRMLKTPQRKESAIKAQAKSKPSGRK